MKRFLTLLAATLMLAAAMCASASASSFDSVADELAAIGMFRGTGNGYDLDRAPTRSEAAIMLTRLFGAEEEAKAAYEKGSLPFTDVSETAAPYVAWVYKKGISNGTSATTFGAANPCSAKMYCAFLLRALGYEDGVDFQYDGAENFAISAGILDTTLGSGGFLRDDLAAVTYQALACDLKDGSTYLLKSLVDSGAVDAGAAKPIMEKIETYRTLNSSCEGLLDGGRLDVSMDMSAKVSYEAKAGDEPVSGVEDMDFSGRLQMILDEKDTKLALTASAAIEGEDVDFGLWIKDGWAYVQSGEDSGKMDVGGELEELKGLYQELLDEAVSTNAGASGAMLPYIESISAKKSGSGAVYTLALSDSFNDLLGTVLDMVMPSIGMDGMDMTFDQCVYTYTVDGNGRLKSVSADASVTEAMEQDGTSFKMAIDMDLGMNINATGNSVKVSYPSGLSSFEDIAAGAE